MAHEIDLSHPDAKPGFRVSPDELSDEAALDAVMSASRMLTTAAFGARLTLLHLGFSIEHSVCKEMDQTAQRYADLFEVARRQKETPSG